MKIKGSELRQWMDEAWPGPGEDWYWDHDLFDEPDPNATYSTDEIGPILHQGSGEDPTEGYGYDLAALIRKWRKTRTHTAIVLTVPNGDVEEVLSLAAERRWSVSK